MTSESAQPVPGARIPPDSVPKLRDIGDYPTASGRTGRTGVLLLGVEPSCLHTALDELRQRFGTIAGYFSDGLGIDADAHKHLRRSFTV